MSHAADNSACPCLTLDLDVGNDDKISWQARESNLAGVGRPGDHKVACLNFDGDRRNTIELLSDLLRLLLDVSPKGDPQRKLVEVTLLRLVKLLGNQLYNALFSDPDLEHKLVQAIQDIKRQKLQLLRIELEFSGDSAALASWPWEYLCSPEDPARPASGTFLVQQAQLVLNRTLAHRYEGRLSTRKPKLLLVVSRPRTAGPVEGDEEAMIQSLRSSGQVDVEALIEPPQGNEKSEEYRPMATWENFKTAIKTHQPHIVHFIGHGRVSFDSECEIGELAFVDSVGAAAWISESDFARNVCDKNPNLRLVFLQACESACADPRANISGVAMRLAHQDVPAVIAMQFKIQNCIANEFAVGFYKKLLNGEPIDVAVKEARDRVDGMEGLSRSQKLAFGMPLVYLNRYEGLIDCSSPPEPSTGGSIGPKSMDSPLKPTLDKCPDCCLHLSELARLKKFCPGCCLALRCHTCAEPLDSPNAAGCFCGSCGEKIPPSNKQDSAPPPHLPPSQWQKGTSSPPSNSELEEELRRRYPSNSSKANAG